jgi:hypothetical protein
MYDVGISYTTRVYGTTLYPRFCCYIFKIAISARDSSLLDSSRKSISGQESFSLTVVRPAPFENARFAIIRNALATMAKTPSRPVFCNF